MKIWTCKIGECDDADLPSAADGPMREAVGRAYREITGRVPTFLFSGCGMATSYCANSRGEVFTRLQKPLG